MAENWSIEHWNKSDTTQLRESRHDAVRGVALDARRNRLVKLPQSFDTLSAIYRREFAREGDSIGA
jgi:hypothetical protein